MDDASIIQLFWNRSEQAIKETSKKYGKLCFKVAHNILSQTEDVEECVNDTYLSLWNSIPSDRPNYFSAYLCRISKNLSIKKMEYNIAQKRNPSMAISLDELNECISGAESTEQNIDLQQLSQSINAFLCKQSKNNRAIFVRRYWFFDTIDEIAANFQMKEKTVSVTLFRTREKLKDYLKKEGYDL